MNEQIYNIFDGEGKLKQLEYGLEAVYNKYEIVGVSNGTEVVFVSKKIPQQPLQAESSNSIFKLADDLYMNITGLPADVDYIVDRSITLANNQEYNFNCKCSPAIFTQALADKMQTYIQRSSKRSPAFAALVAGFEGEQALMHYTDMSAVEFACYAYAAGENYAKMLKYLEKSYKKGNKDFMVQLGISTLLQSIGKDAEFSEIQVAVISKNGIEHLSNQQIDHFLQLIAEEN